MKACSNIFNNVYQGFKEYQSKIKWPVFLFITVFTIGSWIDINGMWCELPIMVHELPEGWKLPSILSTATQLSQIGPILFLISKCTCPKRVSFVVVIYIILVIGAVSCLLLSFFWQKTVYIAGSERSIALYTLTFSLGLLDGTSSVAFLPYIGQHYKKEYIIPTYIGESLSAMIPSILGIIQGVGEDPGCRPVNVTNYDPKLNITKQEEILETIPLKPRFSVSLYFLILCFLLIICTISFSLLNFTRLSKNERKKSASKINVESTKNLYTSENSFDTSKDQMYISANIPSETELNLQVKTDNGFRAQNYNQKSALKPTKMEQYVLFGVIWILSFLAYGTLPALQSYSTLPYGNSTFHLSINLSYVCVPIIILLSIWSYKVSTTRILVEFFISVAITVYIIIISTMSPCPPLQDSWFGKAIMILSWIITTCLYMRIRCLIAAKLEVCGEKVLLIIGFLTMFGQMIAGIMFYFFVNSYKFFESAPSCTDVIQFCKSRN